MIYFTADTHFYHEKMISIANRPYQNGEEMNQSLIANWNRRVGPDDDIYILGDLIMKGHKLAEEVLLQLNGRKYLVRGNHDGFANSPHFDAALLEWVRDYHEVVWRDQIMVLFHYPIEEWNGSFRGSYHLHGHQHNKPDYNYRNLARGLRRYDVGVDANGMTPVSADEILAFFNGI